MFSGLIATLTAGSRIPRPSFEPDALLAVTGIIRRRLPRHRGMQRLSVMRLVYLAQLLHVARTGRGLFDDDILATTYGPLNGRVMKDICRDNPRSDDPRHLEALTTEQRNLVEEVCKHYATTTGGELMGICESPQGAWHRLYGTSADRSLLRFGTEEGPIITMRDMAREWRDRTMPAA